MVCIGGHPVLTKYEAVARGVDPVSSLCGDMERSLVTKIRDTTGKDRIDVGGIIFVRGRGPRTPEIHKTT